MNEIGYFHCLLGPTIWEECNILEDEQDLVIGTCSDSGANEAGPTRPAATREGEK